MYCCFYYLGKPITLKLFSKFRDQSAQVTEINSNKMNPNKNLVTRKPGHEEAQAEIHPQTHKLFLVQHPAIAPGLNFRDDSTVKSS
jgi:hypothetical protein